MSGLTQALAATKNTKAGTVTVFEAPTGTSALSGGNAWREVGVLEPGSIQTDFPKEIHEVKTGIPETTKASFVVGLEGKLNFELIEYTGRAVTIANGGEEATALYGTTPVSTTTTASSTNRVVNLTAVTNLAVGDEIEVAIGSGVETAFITEINSLAVTVYPQFSTAPTTGATVKKVFGYKQAIGGVNLRRKSYLVVFDATDGSQAVIHIPEARAGAGLKPAMPHKQHAKLPVELMAYGVVDNTLTPAAPVVAYHYLLQPGATI